VTLTGTVNLYQDKLDPPESENCNVTGLANQIRSRAKVRCQLQKRCRRSWLMTRRYPTNAFNNLTWT